MANAYPVQLTHLESLYLSDSISMFMQGPPDGLQGQASPYPTLLLKIGGAVLETDQQSSQVTVYFSLPELWVIREVTRSSVVIGSERVGLSLLLKVYAGIRALAAESAIQTTVDEFGEVISNEPGKEDYSDRFEDLKRKGGKFGGKNKNSKGSSADRSADED